jgi:hypothetical protein
MRPCSVRIRWAARTMELSIGKIQRQQDCAQLLKIRHPVKTSRRRVRRVALLNESLYGCLANPSRSSCDHCHLIVVHVAPSVPGV